MKVTLSHFEAALIFALLSSVVLGVVTKRTDKERIHYALTSFGWFVAAVFGLGWLMFLGHR
jgi:hypothetical protein